MNRKAPEKTRRVTFRVNTKMPLPVGEQIFIAGNDAVLGNWKPDGLPLTRVQDCVWTGTAILPAERTIEYKITRGNWQTEEALASGTVSPNKALRPGAGMTAACLRCRKSRATTKSTKK